MEDHVQCLESSSDTSTSVNGVDVNSRSEAGSSNGGHIWDTSGVAVDYTFKVSLTVWHEPMLHLASQHEPCPPKQGAQRVSADKLLANHLTIHPNLLRILHAHALPGRLSADSVICVHRL